MFWLMAFAAPLAVFPQIHSRGHIDFALKEMGRDTLLVASNLVSDLNREHFRLDTILPGQSRYTYRAETDSVACRVAVGSADGTSQYFVLALFPGDHIRVTGSVKDWRVEGSGLNAAYAQVQKACQPYREKLDSLGKMLTEEIYRHEYLPAWQQKDSVQADYVRRHPDDDLSLFILAEIRSKWVDELFPTLTERVKSGRLAPIAQAFEQGFQIRKKFEENRKKMAEGIEAPDFTLNALDGRPLTLSALRGKYVVLDFWGSWCGACIGEFPELKKYYKKYKDRMEILGIDCRDKEETWRNAVERHRLPWLHVRDEDHPDVSLLYAISVYPTTVVVDPEGRIAKIVQGESPVLYEYLDELFQTED